MNAAQLYKDEIYAYFEDPPRGRTPIGAAKVRLRGTESRKSSWETNRKTWALVTVVQPGNTTHGYGKHGYCKVGEELTVPARHLIDFWMDYEAESNLLVEELRERQIAQRRRALREKVIVDAVTWKLQNEKQLHVPAPLLDLYSDGSGFLKFSLDQMLKWLGIDEQEIEEKVDQLMEEG